MRCWVTTVVFCLYAILGQTVGLPTLGKFGPCSAISLSMDNASEYNSNYYANPFSFNMTQCDITPGTGVVWYSLIVVGGSMVTVSTEHPYTTLDTKLYAFSGSCKKLQCIESGNGQISFSVEESILIHIAVTSQTNKFGSFQLTVESEELPVSCMNAIDIPMDRFSKEINMMVDFSFGTNFTYMCNSVYVSGEQAVWFNLHADEDLEDNYIKAYIPWLGEPKLPRITVLQGSCSQYSCSQYTCYPKQYCDTVTIDMSAGINYYVVVTATPELQGAEFRLEINFSDEL